MPDFLTDNNSLPNDTPNQGTIKTERLLLRPMIQADAPLIHEYVNDYDVAYNCVNIPHPYPEGMAESWIATQPERFLYKQAVIFAITHNDELVGAAGIEYIFMEQRYDLGYWIAKPHWGHGYATEAAIGLINYCFETLELTEVFAECLSSNPTSLSVLEKAGMTRIAQIEKACHTPFKLESVEVYHCVNPKSAS